MKQRFFTNTIQSNFIKALIYNTPIPIIGSVNDNSYILKDNIYIYQNNIIKCTNSGIIKMPEFDSSEYTAYYCNGDIKIVASYYHYSTLLIFGLSLNILAPIFSSMSKLEA